MLCTTRVTQTIEFNVSIMYAHGDECVCVHVHILPLTYYYGTYLYLISPLAVYLSLTPSADSSLVSVASLQDS